MFLIKLFLKKLVSEGISLSEDLIKKYMHWEFYVDKKKLASRTNYIWRLFSKILMI